MSIHYIVPARKGSKGFPFKNRTLLHHLDYSDIKNDLIVYTDDESIKEDCLLSGISYRDRDKDICLDNTSLKTTMERYIVSYNLNNEDTIVILYLTYPQRTSKDIKKALSFFVKSKAKSLLCKKECKTSPFLMMLEKEEGRGDQLVAHDYYRRQDYPTCFEISHFMCIFKVFELGNLNSNMYNTDTIFYPINDKVDVDEKEDYETYKNNS